MKPRIITHLTLISVVMLTAGSATYVLAQAQPDFHLEVTIVTGEHSRDSNSTTRTLTVASGRLVYKETYRGAHAGRAPAQKEFKLATEDEPDLIALLKSENLLRTKTISQPPTQKGTSRYFELAIFSAFQGKENRVTIEAGPAAEDLKTNSLYQGSVSLIERLYKIMNRTDPDLTAPTLIN